MYTNSAVGMFRRCVTVAGARVLQGKGARTPAEDDQKPEQTPHQVMTTPWNCGQVDTVILIELTQLSMLAICQCIL